MSESKSNDARSESPGQQIRIRTGARLHFGLLDNHEPFGGVGVMVEQPATKICVTPSDQFSCEAEFRDRLEPIARRVSAAVKLNSLPACRVEVIARPPAHSGLGSGTQLSLAASDAIARFAGLATLGESLAVEISGRGKRSAIGVHGYFNGGLIYERATDETELNPIEQRIDLPSSWSVVVVRPLQRAAVVCGDTENRQFANLRRATATAVEELQRLATEEVLPSARKADFDGFADSVTRYNRASGMLFAEVQGGPYHGESIAKLIEELSDRGIQGIGQSSWGPAIFLWFATDKDANEFVDDMPDSAQLIVHTKPLNQTRKVVG